MRRTIGNWENSMVTDVVIGNDYKISKRVLHNARNRMHCSNIAKIRNPSVTGAMQEDDFMMFVVENNL